MSVGVTLSSFKLFHTEILHPFNKLNLIRYSIHVMLRFGKENVYAYSRLSAFKWAYPDSILTCLFEQVFIVLFVCLCICSFV